MDSIFLLEDGDRAAFLEKMMQAFGCVYVCLKYYVPSDNCLRGLDGIYHERSSTSQGSHARRLFEMYRVSSSYPDQGRIPGLAFTTNNACMKLELHEFQSLVTHDIQLKFYQEAGIKTIVLMGCTTGEIELGMSHDHPQVHTSHQLSRNRRSFVLHYKFQVDLEMEMRNLLRINFPHQSDPNQPQPYSSSSSSLRSLSVESVECSPLFNIPTASRPFVPQPPPIGQDQAVLALNQIRNSQFPTIESEEAEMAKAILAVLCSSSYQNVDDQTQTIPTAFKRYRPNSAPRIAAVNQKHSKFKRAVLFFRNLNISRHESQVQGNRPTPSQMHHMISERRRREKLNESYNILRSLLPPGTKKDKASVLSSTADYLSSLKSQVAELTKRNQMLESQLNSLPKSQVNTDVASSSTSLEERERVTVEIVHVEERLLDLRVRVRGGISLLDLVIRLIEFLKLQNNVTLSSIDSNTRMLGSVSVHAVIMKLRVEGDDEFDESGFLEAVRRVVDDQTN